MQDSKLFTPEQIEQFKTLSLDDYFKTVNKYLFCLTHNSDISEELTQETFFRAYINLSALRNEEKVSAWLCQIAKNAYFTWFNEQKKYKSNFCPVQLHG